MFSFLASGEWRDVIDEGGLPLADRVAVSLRILGDTTLKATLADLSREVLRVGDLTGICLFGLRSSELELFTSYVNRTVDVQSVALASAFMPPTPSTGDRTIERWIATYRADLDARLLYTERALFDHARGKRAREEMEILMNSGRAGEAQRIGEKEKRPQILLRCVFCSITIPTSSNTLNANASKVRFSFSRGLLQASYING